MKPKSRIKRTNALNSYASTRNLLKVLGIYIFMTIELGRGQSSGSSKCLSLVNNGLEIVWRENISEYEAHLFKLPGNNENDNILSGRWTISRNEKYCLKTRKNEKLILTLSGVQQTEFFSVASFSDSECRNPVLKLEICKKDAENSFGAAKQKFKDSKNNFHREKKSVIAYHNKKRKSGKNGKHFRKFYRKKKKQDDFEQREIELARKFLYKFKELNKKHNRLLRRRNNEARSLEDTKESFIQGYSDIEKWVNRSIGKNKRKPKRKKILPKNRDSVFQENIQLLENLRKKQFERSARDVDDVNLSCNVSNVLCLKSGHSGKDTVFPLFEKTLNHEREYYLTMFNISLLPNLQLTLNIYPDNIFSGMNESYLEEEDFKQSSKENKVNSTSSLRIFIIVGATMFTTLLLLVSCIIFHVYRKRKNRLFSRQNRSDGRSGCAHCSTCVDAIQQDTGLLATERICENDSESSSHRFKGQ